jgi:hypothetical protein
LGFPVHCSKWSDGFVNGFCLARKFETLLLFVNTDVSTTKIYLDISVLAKSIWVGGSTTKFTKTDV